MVRVEMESGYSQPQGKFSQDENPENILSRLVSYVNTNTSIYIITTFVTKCFSVSFS